MHIIKRKIYYYDTDAQGVVYYANYLKFLEEARSSYIESFGFNLKKLSDEGFIFAIKRQEIEYKAPVVYGEEIEIRTTIEEITNYRIRFYYEIYNSKNNKTTIARTDMVCVNKNFNLNEIPGELINAIKKSSIEMPKNFI